MSTSIPHQGDQDRVAGFLSRFGEPLLGASDVAVRLTAGLGLADVVRELDAEGIDVDDIELKAPTLDDVFLAKTGRSLEGDAPEEADPTWLQPRLQDVERCRGGAQRQRVSRFTR